jgi:2-polyprenyl-3-methyl-5-hydroxy-6-metoxy-1,4-benzoquinol methylase
MHSSQHSTQAVRTSGWQNKPCDVCGESQHIEVLGERLYSVPTRNGRFEMNMSDALCRSCGFVFASKVPTESFLNDYYASAFIRDAETGLIPPDYDLQFRLDIVCKWIAPNSKILEVGASSGEFCQALAAMGYDARGLDPLQQAFDQSVDHAYLSLGSNNLVATQPVDAVVSYFVLEHVPHAREWLAAIQKMMRPKSILVIEIPNFEAFPEISLSHEHLLHFTPFHIAGLLRSMSFQIREQFADAASRYFGQCVVAEFDAQRAGAAPVAMDVGRRAEILARARDSYRRAEMAKLARDRRFTLLARYVRSIVASQPGPVELICWAANELASELGFKLSEAGLTARAVDSARSKQHTMLDGFLSPVAAPEFNCCGDRQSVFLLCSPNWNSEIAQQIQTFGLSNPIVIDATTWEPAN